MNKTTTPLLFWVALLLAGCSSFEQKANEKGLYTAQADISKPGEVSFFDLFSKAEIISLETNEHSQIRNITKAIPYKNKYYVLDYMNAKIIIFDAAGNYVNKIDNPGADPGEYFNISDFNIDEANKQLVVLTPVNQTMHKYDLAGNFQANYKLPPIAKAYKSFIFLNADTTAYFTFDEGNRLKFYSSKRDSIVKESFPEATNILNNYCLMEFPYGNHLHRPLSDTVYKIEKAGGIIPAYKWDFGESSNTEKQLKELEKIPANEFRSFHRKMINSDIINQVSQLRGGNSRFLFCQLWREGKRINIFHDKTNLKNYVFERTIENAGIAPLYWHEDYMIGCYTADIIDAIDIDDFIPDAILDEKNIAIKKRLTENDNPILIKYYFK